MPACALRPGGTSYVLPPFFSNSAQFQVDLGAEFPVEGAHPPDPTRSAARSGMAWPFADEAVGRVGTAENGSMRVVGVRADEPFEDDNEASLQGICNAPVRVVCE